MRNVWLCKQCIIGREKTCGWMDGWWWGVWRRRSKEDEATLNTIYTTMASDVPLNMERNKSFGVVFNSLTNLSSFFHIKKILSFPKSAHQNLKNAYFDYQVQSLISLVIFEFIKTLKGSSFRHFYIQVHLNMRSTLVFQ